MDIARAFSFLQDDKEGWIAKIFIGGLILCIPFVGQIIAVGYMLRIAERVINDHPEQLPAWDEFGDLLMKGLYQLVISLVYLIPAFVVLGIFFCIGGLGAMSAAESETGSTLVGIIACIIFPLVFILALAGAALSTVGAARFLVTGKLAEAFEFTAVIRHLRENIGNWLMVLVVSLLAGFVASLGIIACFIGVVFTTFYAYCVQGHAIGQVARSMRETPPIVSVTTQL
jgi:amino acid transporter